MNSNIDLANFDRMLELADFGARRHNERRQNLFKAVIAYITLLVLGLYYTLKNEDILDSLVMILIFIGLLVFIHGFYLTWLWTTSVASINDVRRRDFYLKKAERLSYHLSRSGFSSFVPDPCDYIKLNMASGKSWKITEGCLFEMREPNLVIGKAQRKKPCDPKWGRDRHFWALAVLPTAILFLLIAKLIDIMYSLDGPVVAMLSWLIVELSGKV